MIDPVGRVVLVSGASRGIGRAIAERLISAGCLVSAGVRDPATAPAGSLACLYDATGSPAEWVAQTLAAHGRIDALVNAAGINPKAHFLSEDEAPFEEMWRVNSMAPMRVIRAAWPSLLASGTGRVVNVSSLSGKRVRNDNTGYAMSKFALMALTQAVRREGFSRGVRASALSPGFVATDMTMAADFDRGQMTTPGDLAELAFMLLHLPNNATIAELLVNCRLEAQL